MQINFLAQHLSKIYFTLFFFSNQNQKPSGSSITNKVCGWFSADEIIVLVLPHTWYSLTYFYFITYSYL